jgi:CRISPR-associated endonuclease Cas1
VAGFHEDNEHTTRGQHVHRRVDRAGGAIPAPEAAAGDPGAERTTSTDADAEMCEPPTEHSWAARGLWLSDEALGVTAKLDLVESLGSDLVRPVETKKSNAPEEGLWPNDEVQVILQALLLRAQRYQVRDVAVWYAGSRKRVTLPLTPEREAWAREQVVEAGRVAQASEPPEPLVDSPKCVGCSLAPICQPDEVSFLQGMLQQTDGEIRRLVAPHDDALPLIVQSFGARVGVSKQSLVVYPGPQDDWKKEEVGLGTVSEVMLFGSVQMTAQAVQLCLSREIPIHHFGSGGWYYGSFMGHASRWPEVRRAQYRMADSAAAVLLARQMIADKIANQRTLLRRNLSDEEQELHPETLDRLRHAAHFALDQDTAPSLLGVEGDAARRYWELFAHLVARDDEAWRPAGRSRRPPRDPVNAMLGFGYALLTKDATRAVHSAGMDPYVGIYHTVHHGRPSMALDLMEPFRPLVVDSMVLQMIRRREVQPDDFMHMGQEVRMKPHARKTLLQAYERRMEELITHPSFGYRVSYRRAIMIQGRLLARVMTGELERWPSFRTR